MPQMVLTELNFTEPHNIPLTVISIELIESDVHLCQSLTKMGQNRLYRLHAVCVKRNKTPTLINEKVTIYRTSVLKQKNITVVAL